MALVLSEPRIHGARNSDLHQWLREQLNVRRLQAYTETPSLASFLYPPKDFVQVDKPKADPTFYDLLESKDKVRPFQGVLHSIEMHARGNNTHAWQPHTNRTHLLGRG